MTDSLDEMTGIQALERTRRSLDDLVSAAAGTTVYGEDRRTLRQVLLANLRRELCGDDSFREKVEEYNKNPAQAALLTGQMVYVVELP